MAWCGRRAQSAVEGVVAGVTEPLMPNVGGDGGEGVVRFGRGHGVEIAVIITSENHPLRPSFLNRKTVIVKFDVNRIIFS